MIPTVPYRLLANRAHGTPGIIVLPEGGFRRAKAEISSWPGYAPTPLRALDSVATTARVAAVHYKDEAARFGLGSFKALGGAYAVLRLLIVELARRGVAPNAPSSAILAGEFAEATRAITVTCATDGNHGRSVAWGAARCHARCVIFVHPGVTKHRRDAIAAYGAEIREVPGNYDDSVRAAASEAEAQGWFVVSDTSWPGYTEVPRDVMQGYRLMAEEAAEQIPAPPTHVFIQAGVGGVAAAVAVQMRARFGDVSRIIVVEPDRAACLLAGAEAGEPQVIGGALDTVMAGLACGEVSLLAWQELSRSAYGFMAVPDAVVAPCMKLLAAQGIVAGESGVAGLAALLLAGRDPFARAVLRLEADSRVLLFGTEGATDPALYAQFTA